jgi:hypothetical protein
MAVAGARRAAGIAGGKRYCGRDYSQPHKHTQKGPQTTFGLVGHASPDPSMAMKVGRGYVMTAVGSRRRPGINLYSAHRYRVFEH